MCATEVLLYGLKDWWIRERKKGLLDTNIASRPDCPDGTTCRRQKEHVHAREFNHVFDSEEPAEPSSAAASAPISSVGPEGDGAATPTSTSTPIPQADLAASSFSSQTSSRGVRSHPSLDSEAMVDAALSNMMHDVEGLPSSLPLPLPNLAASPMQQHVPAHGLAHLYPHPRSHAGAAAAARAALNIFDVL